MPYLKNALGCLGRSVTDTARLAFAQAGAAGRAARWRKLAVYAAMFALPGGSFVVLLFMWAKRRRAEREAHAGAAPAVFAACSGGQLACRAAGAPGCASVCAPAGTQACAQESAPQRKVRASALHTLRRWRRNRA